VRGERGEEAAGVPVQCRERAVRARFWHGGGREGGHGGSSSGIAPPTIIQAPHSMPWEPPGVTASNCRILAAAARRGLASGIFGERKKNAARLRRPAAWCETP
jgi:hypothetical protein